MNVSVTARVDPAAPGCTGLLAFKDKAVIKGTVY